MSNQNEIDSMDVDSNQIEPTEPTESANKTINNSNNDNNNDSNNNDNNKIVNGKTTTATTQPPPPPPQPQPQPPQPIMDSKRKTTLQERLRKLVKETRNIIVSGCGNWRCTNPNCQSNILNMNRSITPAEASKLALKMIKLKSKKCLQYPNLSITPISYNNIQPLINNNNNNENENKSEEKNHDNSKINKIIMDAFTHWDIFCDSFKTDQNVSENDVAINFNELHKTFDIIMSQEDLCKDISDALEDVMDKYLCNLRSSSSTKPSLSDLRSLIILVFFPLILSEDLTCHLLLNKFLLIFEEINSSDFKSIRIIHKWMSKMNGGQKKRILHSLHQYMTLIIIQRELDIEDLTEDWKIELKYDDTEDNDERDEISQEIEKKQQLEREKYILSKIAPTIKFIDIIFIANKTVGGSDDDDTSSMKMEVDDEEKKEENDHESNIDILHTINQKRARLEIELFHNDGLNDAICSKTQSRSHIHRRDFIHYKEHDFFTFLSYPYLLNAGSKSRYLEFENLLRQHRARRRRMFDLMLSGGVLGGINRNQLIEELDLVLRIRRDSIITDTLGILQLQEPQHLRKRLRIIFDGEQGIDQGGLTKEYFQLIMKELFDPNYGMFIYNSETENYWFNRDSFDVCGGLDNKTQLLCNYELVGKLVGIAIYNNTILDLRFPRVIFKKLLETELIEFNDFIDYDPQMAKGFKQLLLYKGADLSDVYCRNFIVKWKNIFGQSKEYQLIDGGSQINLTQENKQKYVDLYIKYILIHSIEQQFNAFLKGFKIVCDSELFNKYSSKELELLICGSETFDFDALESSTKYEDGLNKNSKIVRDFWNIVHQLSDENKRKLLTFCTGSDRVPINGLGEVTLTISKNGNDNSKLPTSHTCFNHLLLPEYSNKEILKQRLLTAINNSEGFGLL